MTDLFTIEHGAGGLWEVHRWNGALDLNVQDTKNGIFVDKITGLHALPEHEDARDKRTGRIGERIRPVSFEGKTVVYEGEIRGATVPLLRAQRTALVAAFTDLTTEGHMDLIPHVDAGGPTARYHARVIDLDQPEETHRDFRRDFSLSLRLSDPRFYYPSLAVDVTHASAAVVTHPGDAPVEPIITVAGVSGDAAISDGTHTLTFENCPAGTLVVDFDAKTAKVGSTHVELNVALSDWWDAHIPGIQPGTTTVGQDGGTSVRVQFTPATWG